MELEYPWYQIVENSPEILQGDFIQKCPIIIPPSQITDDFDVKIKDYNVIIMSQSCDIVQKKIDLVLVCPYWPLSEFENVTDILKGKEGKEILRKGNMPGYHLLNKCEIEGFETDFLVVDFRSVFSVPLKFLFDLMQKDGKRLRLLPPYREHLSQAFARFFMRVGLPVDIPPFK